VLQSRGSREDSNKEEKDVIGVCESPESKGLLVLLLGLLLWIGVIEGR
jgi:hypothetical protein